MALTLYGLSGSPYTWRVQLALAHKGLPCALEWLSYDAGDFKSDRLGSLNPRRRVPVLVDGDFVLYESAAIVEYLDERGDGGLPLFSRDTHRRALQRRLVREADQYLAAAMERLVDEVLFTPAERWSDDRIAGAHAAIRDELARWEAMIPEAGWLLDDLSAADFALFPLVMLVRRIGQRKPPDAGLEGPRLAAWIDRMTALPVVQQTWPPHWRR